MAKKQARRLSTGNHLKKTGPPSTLIIYGSIIGGLLLAAAVFLLYSNRNPGGRTVSPASGAAQSVGEQVPLETATHIEPPSKGQYVNDPPTSGRHYSIAGKAPVALGYHDEAIPPEYWVHNLEHGGVAILYSCPDGCPADRASIKRFVLGAPAESDFQEVKIVATSYPVPGHRFALVAWGWRLFLDTWDSNQAERFYEAHVDHGPESVP